MGGGYIQFNAAFKESVVVTLINSVITAVFSIVYLQFIDPTFMDFIMQKQVTKMQEMGMAEDQIQKMLDQSAKWQSPGMMFFWALLGSVVLGFIIALIMAAIMKKPNPEEII
jgi:ABC-type antimicrobial peptide transport system permease subunit